MRQLPQTNFDNVLAMIYESKIYNNPKARRQQLNEMREYYLDEYIEDYDGTLSNVEVVDEFDIHGQKYSVLRRNDGMEFVVLDYEGDNEYIWVSVGEETADSYEGDDEYYFELDSEGVDSEGDVIRLWELTPRGEFDPNEGFSEDL